MDELTIEQVCEILGDVSRRWVERQKRAGKLSAREVQHGRTRRMMYRRDEVEALAAKRRDTTRHTPTVFPVADAPTKTAALSLRRGDTPRHVATRNDATHGDGLRAIAAELYAGEAQRLAERHAELTAESARAADALAVMAAASSPVLSLAEARRLFKLSERDIKNGCACGALAVRRGARGAKTLLRTHLEQWVRALHTPAVGENA